MNAAHTLMAARLNRGLSVRKAAREMKVDRRTLERAESGQHVHPSSAKRIADFYDCRVTDIWPIPDREAS